MRLTLVLGGARSGKTRWAVEWAEARGGGDVSYIATAVDTPDDPEMTRRIARHRRDRRPAWQTIEESRDPVGALAAARHGVVVLDCFTLLLSNRLVDAVSAGAVSEDTISEAAVEAEGRELVESLLAAASSRTGTLVVVSNEVGQGVVPAHPLGRWFRDAQGRANQALAAASERAVLIVAGLPVYLKGAP